ncbi:unnamed protein product [Amoebophrya sp. A25]|nr:unnamed protein product [Amoebophrya sp. A25]|eukprot:GSA25T00000004001.1
MAPVRMYAGRRLSRRDMYWPPMKRTSAIPIGGSEGKRAFVFHGKSEESGLLEPQVAVTLTKSLKNRLVFIFHSCSYCCCGIAYCRLPSLSRPVCIYDRGLRLPVPFIHHYIFFCSQQFSLTAEELGEIEKLAPRISAYFDLSEDQVRGRDREVQREKEHQYDDFISRMMTIPTGLRAWAGTRFESGQ